MPFRRKNIRAKEVIHVNRKFYTVCAAFLLIIWPLVAALGLYALGQPLPSLALLTSPRFLAMQLIVDYSVMLTFVACALFFNKRTAKHANVIDELQEKLVKSERENDELNNVLAESEHKRKEAEAIARQYWKMIPEDQRATYGALRIANSNRVQHTSGS